MIKTIKILLGLVLANLWACQTFAQARGISYMNGKYLLDTNTILENRNLPALLDSLVKDTLAEKKNIKEIPVFLMNFLKELNGFSIANRGEAYQSPDVRLDRPLPTRQLIYFGLGKDIALMTYYTSGCETEEHLLIMKFSGTTINDLWCDEFSEDVTNIKEIINFLQKNKDTSERLDKKRIWL